MKILTRKQFLDTPPETLFSYYDPCSFRGLYIKTSDNSPNGYSNDFLYDDLIAPVECNNSSEYLENIELCEKGGSMSLDFEYTDREGLFEYEQLFAIYEKEDVKKLIKRLQDMESRINSYNENS